METIKIRIRYYDRETPELKAIWKKSGLQAFDSLHFQFKRPPEGEHEVETNLLFSNQYNTVSGYRIFEKRSCLQADTHAPLHGYYISEGIEELRKAQKNQLSCGYCGKRFDKKTALIFCDKCVGSEYLEEKHLPLLRLLPVYPDRKNHPPLTESEKAELLAVVLPAQAATRKRIAAEKIEAIKAQWVKTIANAEAEKDRFLWLLDREIITDNVIYYDHTGVLTFGWREPLTEVEKAEITEKMHDCPYVWTIKDGKK